jgi:hypothetical protein
MKAVKARISFERIIAAKIIVDDRTVSEFIRDYHVRNRMYDEEFDVLVESYTEDLEKLGYTIVPAHISITGKVVFWSNKRLLWKKRAKGSETVRH